MVSLCRCRWYSCSTQAWVARLSSSRVSCGSPFEHRHQPALDLGEEDLLLAVLLGRLRQRGVVLDRQALEALGSLGGEHGRAVVAEQAARQAALREGLAQAMDEALGVTVADVPLQVAAQARVVVDHGEQGGVGPLAAGGQDLAPGLVEVAVPQPMHVGHLEEPALARHEAGVLLVAPRAAVLAQPVMLHVAAHRGVARQDAQRRLLAPQRHQVVVDQLVAPARVLLAQGPDRLGHRHRHAGMRARVLGHLALERPDRVLLVASAVVPALEGLEAEADGLARRRVTPRPRRQLRDARGQLAGLGRCAQQRADDGKAQPCPAHPRGGARLVGHGSRTLRNARGAENRHPLRESMGGGERPHKTRSVRHGSCGDGRQTARQQQHHIGLRRVAAGPVEVREIGAQALVER